MDTGIGRPLRRKEDFRLLTGSGRFSDDLNLPGQAHAYVLRAPHAHADVGAIDVTAAAAAAGVLAVLTGADYRADGLKGIVHGAMPFDTVAHTVPALSNQDGSPAFTAPHMPLADGKVRHVGEGVALVVAESLDAARDAAELISVDYTALPAVTRQMAALAPDAPRLWDGAPGNLCFDAMVGDPAATDAAFAAAAHVVSAAFESNRIVNAQMEPRAAIGVYDRDSGRYTLYAGSQGVHRQKAILAELLGEPADKVRVVSGDVGGGFGPRSILYPEFALAVWAARRVGRPVKWTCERGEAFVTDCQARDLVTEAALALDADGRFRAMRVTLYSNVGANTVSFVPIMNGTRIATTLYAVPAVAVRALGILTNTLPCVHYRAAGRPQAMHAMERLIDIAAGRLGIDRIELRRRNLIPIDAFPYVNPTGLVYDSGEFEANMDWAADLAGHDGFAARRAQSERRGRLRGIGIANYIETPAGVPLEWASIAVRKEGAIDLLIGTQSSGQGHETAFAQVISEWLGVPADDVRMVTGDSEIIPIGGGTHSDRSIRMGGKVMVDSAEKIIAKGKAIAAIVLEAAEADIAFAGGRFTVAGTDRSLSLYDVAEAAGRSDLPDELKGELKGGLRAETRYDGRLAAFPNGCAVCEVEIDPDTGTVEIVRYSAVDDVGRVVNPMIVDGQVHGGIAQGVGQALMEHCVYDPADGQILTGSFLDYCMPRADDLPSFAVEMNEVPTAGNPLGVKGGGETGTTPALASVMTAVVDALAPCGITEFQLPATSERVWRAIREATGHGGLRS